MNVQLNCTELAYLRADLIYSDSEGRITASTLLDMFLTWMLSQDNPSIKVNGLRIALSKQCPTQLNVLTSDDCIKTADAVGSTVLIAAGFFGGLIAGIVVTLITVRLIYW